MVRLKCVAGPCASLVGSDDVPRLLRRARGGGWPLTPSPTAPQQERGAVCVCRGDAAAPRGSRGHLSSASRPRHHLIVWYVALLYVYSVERTKTLFFPERERRSSMLEYRTGIYEILYKKSKMASPLDAFRRDAGPLLQEIYGADAGGLALQALASLAEEELARGRGEGQESGGAAGPQAQRWSAPRAHLPESGDNDSAPKISPAHASSPTPIPSFRVGAARSLRTTQTSGRASAVAAPATG